MKLRYFTLLLIAFFSVNLIAQEGWTVQTTTANSPLRAVYAIDALNVWATGSNGIVIHSMDGGETWDSIPTNATRYQLAIEFVNADTGFVAGRDDGTGTPSLNHLLQRTVDGGLTWEFINLVGGQQNTVFDIDFVEGPPGEPMRGYAAAGLAHVWITKDWGATWDRASGDCGEGNFNSCYFTDSITGWFVGTPSNVKPYTIMYTDDGGKSFVEQEDPNEIKLNGVSFGSDLKGIAVGLNGIVMYTSDGGTTWETCTDEVATGAGKWNSVVLSESGKAWAVGNNSAIAYSSDWGHTWELQEADIGPYAELSDVYFINDSVGWIVGGISDNIILHTKNGGMSGAVTGIETDKTGSAYSLEHNYPNPFSSSTMIEYKLSYPGQINLTVYDISGRKVESLVNEFQPAGEYTVNWDASQFSEGIYFCELKVDQGPAGVKKMVLKR